MELTDAEARYWYMTAEAVLNEIDWDRHTWAMLKGVQLWAIQKDREAANVR